MHLSIIPNYGIKVLFVCQLNLLPKSWPRVSFQNLKREYGKINITYKRSFNYDGIYISAVILYHC